MRMLDRSLPTFKHIFKISNLLLAMLSGLPAYAADSTVDLLDGGSSNWLPADSTWAFENGEIAGASCIMDGAITEPTHQRERAHSPTDR